MPALSRRGALLFPFAALLRARNDAEWITRLGGQIVAALYLADGPLSMDTLSADLGRSKSNIFANLRALEAAGIVMRTRESGTRYDTFALDVLEDLAEHAGFVDHQFDDAHGRLEHRAGKRGQHLMHDGGRHDIRVGRDVNAR